MENFRAIKFLSTVEKFINIHRDYLYLSMRQRIFIIFVLIIEMTIYSFVWYDSFCLFQALFVSQRPIFYMMATFHFLYTVQSVALILYYAPRFGREFQSILSNLSYTHEIVKHYLPYQNFLSRLNLKCRLIITAFVVARISLNIIVVWAVIAYPEPNNSNLSTLSYISYFTSDGWSESRYVLALLMYICLLAIITNVLKTIRVVLTEIDVVALEHNLDAYAKVYRQLLDTVRRIKKSFSHHVSIRKGSSVNSF